MSSRRMATGLFFLVLLSLLSVLLFFRGQVAAGGRRAPDPSARAYVAWATNTVAEAEALGYVLYDGEPVEGAIVSFLRDETVVYTTTTALGAGTVPSFTVTLSRPPISAVTEEILTLAVAHLGAVNRTTFVVEPGEQTLRGWLSSTCGETEITNGLISADTTWTPECGPYLIRTNVLVVNEATLTIEAGTTVMFDADKALQINGRLLSQGTRNALVSFTAGQGLAWGYLSFAGGSTGSALEHTLVEYAGSLVVDPNAAVRVDGGNITLQGLIVRHSLADGIQIFNDGTATMAELMVLDNQGCGIEVDSDTTTLSIQNSVIRNNQAGGIVVENGASGTLSGNVIENNVGLNGAGLRLSGVGTLLVEHNRVVGNDAGSSSGGGILAVYTGDVMIRDNFIATNEARYGGGIYAIHGAVTEVSRNFILLNQATRSNGRAGSGLYISNHDDELTIAHNIIAGNTTIDSGQGGGAVFSALDDATAQYNTFAYNFSTTNGGAAFHLSEPEMTLAANTIFSNTATSSPLGDYGAVQIASYVVTLNDNNFFDNSAYDLQNSVPLAQGTVNAQFNWWGTADPGAIPERIYDWYDDASVGMVDYANWLNAPRTDAPISPPTGAAAAANGAAIGVSWLPNPEADVAGYKIFLDTAAFLFDPAVNGTLAGIDVGLQTAFSVTCLAPDTHYLAITAYDADADGVDDWTDGHESWFSRELEVTTTAPPVCGPLATPTDLDATPVSASQIDLDWTDNAVDETSVRIERSPDGGTNWAEVASVGVNVTAYSDTGLDCDAGYGYRVRAHRAGDDRYSAYSSVAQATTLACAPALPAPTDLDATPVSASQIDLDWTDNAVDETSVRIERSPDGGTNWTEVASVGANVTAYSDTGLDCDAGYGYRVRAHRAGDDRYSAYSNVAQATTGSCAVQRRQYLPSMIRR